MVQLTGADGSVTKNYDYDAFGNEKSPDANDSNVFRNCGEYFDKETGTVYLRARYYDPEVGRFISEDSYWGKSSDPLSLNLYTYCHNDAVNYLDPSGHLESDGKNFWYILNRSDSTYSYYVNEIEKAGEWNVPSKIFDWAYNLGLNTYIGYTSAGAGYYPNQVNICGGLCGAAKGLTELGSGSGMNDVAKQNLANLEYEFGNLGDQAYRIRTAEGRKIVINEMNHYILTLKNELSGKKKYMDSQIKENKEYYDKISLAHQAGIITDNKYKEYMKTYYRGLDAIDLLQRVYTKTEAEYKILIGDANEIININK